MFCNTVFECTYLTFGITIAYITKENIPQHVPSQMYPVTYTFNSAQMSAGNVARLFTLFWTRTIILKQGFSQLTFIVCVALIYDVARIGHPHGI